MVQGRFIAPSTSTSPSNIHHGTSGLAGCNAKAPRATSLHRLEVVNHMRMWHRLPKTKSVATMASNYGHREVMELQHCEICFELAFQNLMVNQVGVYLFPFSNCWLWRFQHFKFPFDRLPTPHFCSVARRAPNLLNLEGSGEISASSVRIVKGHVLGKCKDWRFRCKDIMCFVVMVCIDLRNKSKFSWWLCNLSEWGMWHAFQFITPATSWYPVSLSMFRIFSSKWGITLGWNRTKKDDWRAFSTVKSSEKSMQWPEVSIFHPKPQEQNFFQTTISLIILKSNSTSKNHV